MDPTTRNSPRILVVDDEPLILGFFSDLYEQHGISIDTAANGAAGLERVRARSYNLIFLDVVLGDRDGLEILRIMSEEGIRSEVVLISGYMTEEIIQKGLRLGAIGYLYKPLNVRDILSLTLKVMATTTQSVPTFKS